MTVRTRIAPSPTGDPHVGTAYIALFNYCFARQHGGTFVLRIEDTDQVRSTRQSEEMILEALKWTGITWGEGPDVGGPHGPYRQSERSELYAKEVQTLLDSGHAFHCFCDKERLDALRAKQDAEKTSRGYDGHCIHHSEEDVAARLAAGEEHVIRMKVPREGECVFTDRLRGEVRFPWAEVDMQVLMKSDGLPTYHLANVVDDHHMAITHVIRGEEWISSAPKHILLYESFGWEAPELIHLPLLRNPDKSKLSKRKNPTSILYYERIGVLPEVLLNYLGMMGWSMPDGREKFSLEEMIEHFDIDRVSLGGPVFDVAKLEWLNQQYIQHMDNEALSKAFVDWAINHEYLMPILEMLKPRAKKLTEFAPLAHHFFIDVPELTPESFSYKKALEPDRLIEVLQFGLWRLEAQREWSPETVEHDLKDTAARMEMKLGDFLKPFFVCLSGSTVSTPLFESLGLIGPDLTRARIRHALETLGGVSGKKSKKLKKAYDAMMREDVG